MPGSGADLGGCPHHPALNFECVTPGGGVRGGGKLNHVEAASHNLFLVASGQRNMLEKQNEKINKFLIHIDNVISTFFPGERFINLLFPMTVWR